MSEKIGSLIIDLQGTTVSAEERELINHPLTGGVILFSRNYEAPGQLSSLCQQIRAATNQARLIMVDQEGGRVQRFRDGFTDLPAMAAFGMRHDHDAAAACLAAHECGWLMAMELLMQGVDLSLAPVLDLNKGVSAVIGQRAFHAHPDTVIKLAAAFTAGMQEAGMAATGKHFPGHGSVSADSHHDMAVDNRLFSEIVADDMRVFAGMIKANLPAVMAAHVIFPQVDDMPVGFSRYWLQTVLRQQLKFNGVIISDDLNMAGANIAERHADRVLAAREAGCDLVLLCNNRSAVIDALDHIPADKHRIEKNKWGVLQGRFPQGMAHLHQHAHVSRLQNAREIIETINTGMKHANHT